MALSTDPIDFLLNPTTGDLVIGTDIAFSSGITGIAQGIRIAVQMIKGEWFYNLDEGVPYFERSNVPASEALLAQNYDERKTLAAFRIAIQTAPGVNTIQSLTTSFNGAARTVNISWVVTTVFGDTIADTLAVGVN